MNECDWAHGTKCFVSTRLGAASLPSKAQYVLIPSANILHSHIVLSMYPEATARAGHLS